MTDKTKIILIYSTVVLVGIVVIGASIWASKSYDRRFAQQPIVTDVGKEEPDVLMDLEGDLELTNQAGESVKLSDLDGKVWVVHQFFANCPVCLKQNSGDLIKLYKEFNSHPDFQFVSISVDPDNDTVEQLSKYAKAMGADAKNWWFVRGDKKEVHRFLTKNMKYAPVIERPDAEAAKRFAHDYGVQVYGRERRLIRHRDLVSAESFGEEYHADRFNEVRERIALRLKTPLPPREAENTESPE